MESIQKADFTHIEVYWRCIHKFKTFNSRETSDCYEIPDNVSQAEIYPVQLSKRKKQGNNSNGKKAFCCDIQHACKELVCAP